jgi:hypothetical protein
VRCVPGQHRHQPKCAARVECRASSA